MASVEAESSLQRNELNKFYPHETYFRSYICCLKSQPQMNFLFEMYFFFSVSLSVRMYREMKFICRGHVFHLFFI